MLDHTPEVRPADDNTHPLTGSTPPGSDTPPFQPVASASEPRRNRGADVMLIRHARRVGELAREEHIACELVCDLEERADREGLAAQQKVYDRLFKTLKAQTMALTKMPATSRSALAAKARAYIEVAEAGNSDGWTEEFALSIVKDMVRVMAVPVEKKAGDAPDRRALEAYREWLHHESLLLGDELYGRGRDMIPVNTAAYGFHFPSGAAEWRDVPPPSSRAEGMCDMLGLDWRTDDAAQCARRRGCADAIADGEVEIVGEVA